MITSVKKIFDYKEPNCYCFIEIWPKSKFMISLQIAVINVGNNFNEIQNGLTKEHHRKPPWVFVCRWKAGLQPTVMYL